MKSGYTSYYLFILNILLPRVYDRLSFFIEIRFKVGDAMAKVTQGKPLQVI